MDEHFDISAIGNFEKELLELYIKYGWGEIKLYNILALNNLVNDETVLLTVQEFYDKSHPYPDFEW